MLLNDLASTVTPCALRFSEEMFALLDLAADGLSR